MKLVTQHDINGRFVDSHGTETLDIINPTNRKVIARLTLGDEQDMRNAIAAAKKAFPTYSRTTNVRRIFSAGMTRSRPGPISISRFEPWNMAAALGTIAFPSKAPPRSSST